MIKKLLLKFNILVFMLAFSAGIICFAGGFLFVERVPRRVTVNGIEVGGMSRADAAEKIRQPYEEYLKGRQLKIIAESAEYTFRFPEIYYSDDVYNILKNARKKGEYTAEFKPYLCGLSEIAPRICLNESILVAEPYAEFHAHGKPFTYYEGNDGREVDGEKLLADIKNSLAGDFMPVKLCYKAVSRTESLQKVKANTQLLMSFTTYFDGMNLNRASNIRVAAAKLNGKIIQPQKTLSFNDTVGARVKTRGFLPAKIIENGEFTEGVGGGVCQVSTTLYNAAVLSGLKIEEYHPHSLAVGYVSPSRDAMVSGTACDLKIFNPKPYPVYIRSAVSDGSVTFDIYGRSDGAEYSIVSEVIGEIAPPEEISDDPLKAREGKSGTISVSYLEIKRGENVERVLLRKDKYKPVKTVKFAAPESPDTEEPAPPEIADFVP